MDNQPPQSHTNNNNNNNNNNGDDGSVGNNRSSHDVRRAQYQSRPVSSSHQECAELPFPAPISTTSTDATAATTTNEHLATHATSTEPIATHNEQSSKLAAATTATIHSRIQPLSASTNIDTIVGSGIVSMVLTAEATLQSTIAAEQVSSTTPLSTLTPAAPTAPSAPAAPAADPPENTIALPTFRNALSPFMLHPGEQQQHQQQHQLRQQQQQPSEIIMVPIMPHASNQSTATMTSTASSGGSDAGILFTDSSSSHSSNANRGSAIITGAQLAETIDHYAMHQGPLQHLPVHQQPLLFPLPSTGIQRSQSAVALHETVYTEIQQLASVGEAQDYIRNHLARWIMYHGQLRMIRDENGNIFAGLMRDPANVAMDLNLNTQISHMYAELDVLASNFLTAAAAGGVGQAEEGMSFRTDLIQQLQTLPTILSDSEGYSEEDGSEDVSVNDEYDNDDDDCDDDHLDTDDTNGSQ